ncbi:MAG: c-type cytochrome [Chitinophagaceae bacterium]|nr:c-type cytochrome [Chitinophagaceae bacterium]
MKKLLFILVLGTAIYACGDNTEEKKAETPAATDTAKTPAPAPDATASNDKGLELIGSNDCMSCHTIETKLVGPAYKDVAAKYENTEANIDTLVHKIQKGGTGNWGNIPMTPHPNLSDADAKEMVKYILSLKK